MGTKGHGDGWGWGQIPVPVQASNAKARHIECKESDDWVSACRSMVVESVKGRGRGRPRKTWRQCVDEDMAKLNLSVMDTHDRAVWRNGILGNHLTRADCLV